MEALEDRTLPTGGLVDPGAVGPLAVTTQEYNFGNQAFTPTPFPGNGVELIGEVKAPTTLTGQLPLVILLHGQHETSFDPTTGQLDDDPVTHSPVWPPPAGHLSIPSYHGYDYFASVLASNGYIVVSISANGVNAHANDSTVTDGGAQARAQLIQRTLDIWHDLNADGVVHTRGQSDHFADGQMPFMTRFVGHVNLQDVGLMGHSRGGEGVVKAYQLNQSLGSPYGIKAVFALAPTDVNGEVINNVPFAVLLPYNDGDVHTLQGAHYFDDSRYNFVGDTGAKFTIEVMGADHNYYNTVWSPDSSFPGGSEDRVFPNFGPPTRLTEPQQRGTGVAYMSAFFRTYLGPTTQFLSILDSDSPPPPSATVSANQIHTSYLPPDDPAQRRDINRLNVSSNTTTNNLGGLVTIGGGATSSIVSNPQPSRGLIPYPNEGFELSLHYSNTTAAFFQNDIPVGVGDERGYSALQFRVGVDHASSLNQLSNQDFSVQLTDGSGHIRSVLVSAFSNDLFKPPISVNPHTVLNTVRIPLSAFATAGFNLSDVRSVRFNFDQPGQPGQPASGAFFLADLAFTADVLGVQMSDGNNNLVIQNDPAAPANVQVFNATTSAVLGEFLISSLHSITVACDSSTDTLTVSYQNGDPLPFGGLAYLSGSGTDTLDVNDQTTATAKTWTLADNSVQRADSAPITYPIGLIDFVNVNGGTGNNTYNVLDTEFFGITTVHTGPGVDAVNVQGTSTTTRIDCQGGGGLDVVTVGNGLTQGIQGAVTVTSPVSLTHLIVNDSQDTAGLHQVSLTADSATASITGLSATISYDPAHVNAVDVRGGSGVSDTWTVAGTAANPSNPLTTITRGAGFAEFDVQATSAHGPLAVGGGTGGTDHVVLGRPVSPVASTLSGIQGDVTVASPNPSTSVQVNGSGDTAAHPNVQLLAGQLTGLFATPAVALHFDPASLHDLTLTGGQGTDTYMISATLVHGTTTLSNGSGVKVVNVQGTSAGGLLVGGNFTGLPGVFDTVNVGNAGHLGGITGTLSVRSPVSANNLVIDGSADPAPANALLGLSPDGFTGQVTGLAGAEIDYGVLEVHSVEVKTGGAGTATGLITVANTMRTQPTRLDVGGSTSTVKVLATTGPLTVNCGGPDTVILGQVDPTTGLGTLQNIQGAVTLLNANPGPTGLADVTLNDYNDTQARTVNITPTGITGLTVPSAPLNLSATSVAVLDIGGPLHTTGSSWTITGTPASEQLQLAAPGPDTVHLQAAAAGIPSVPTTTIVASPTIIVGQVDPTGRGTLQGIQGRVLIANSYFAQFSGQQNHFSPASVQVNDANDPNPQMVTISSDGISRQSAPAAPINQIPGPTGISSIGILTYLGGVSSTGNTWTITGTPATTALILSAPGSDTVNVQATAAGTTTNIQGGTGPNEIVNVGSTANLLDPILGVVNVTDQTGRINTLNINDTGSTTPHTYTKTATQVTRSPGGPVINFSNVQNVNLHPGRLAGSGPSGPGSVNVINVLSIAAGTTVTVDPTGGDMVNVGNGQDGLDELQGPLQLTGDGTVALTVNDQMTAGGQEYDLKLGELDRSGIAPITFSGLQGEVVNGGANGNTFDVDGVSAGTPVAVNTGLGSNRVKMRQHDQIQDALTLNGQGSTALGYVAYSSDVFVDFQLGVATDISSFSGISQITGGAGRNILVGDGHESITGGTGPNLMISGGGSGQIVGGGAGDILIGGSTAYDQDQASLQAIMDYWTLSGDDYATRVANLQAGNGVPQLAAGVSVFDNGAANTITGNGNEGTGALNLFFYTNAGGAPTDQQPSEVAVNLDGV
jgi:hypothetical protein